jgi:CSLREA domain-containing protein
MRYRTLLLHLLPVLVLAACTEQEPPTAPLEPGGPALALTAGQKIVNSLADPGDGTCNAAQCTLREAIKDPESTQISFASGLSGGTITLARPGLGGGSLVIDKQLTITGLSTQIIIRRRSTDPEFRIFQIGSAATVKLINLRIQNGKTGQTGGGGGIINRGTLKVANCGVAGNSAILGGGISNVEGRLTLANSRVANNQGGGISSVRGTLTVTHSVVEGNKGGIGISAFRNPSTVIDTRIIDNSGGGISNAIGTFTLRRSTIAGNSSSEGGGISNSTATFMIFRSTITDNTASGRGGGIFNTAIVRLSSRITITNSTVSGNSATSGGGVVDAPGFASTAIELINSTVARNSATQEGGGVLAVGADALVSLTNSLVGQNSAPTGPDVLEAPNGTAIARFSLIGNGSGSGITNTDGNQVGTASNPIDPKIGPLADNGGPTRTHALLLGSRAIDAASTPDCPTIDQRGVTRPQGPACDIGSYERK